jgi:hypothetical protein
VTYISAGVPEPLPSFLPAQVQEDHIQPFKFYRENAIQQGMRFRNALYGLVCELRTWDGLDILYAGLSHWAERSLIIVSTSRHRYRVWASFSPSSSIHLLGRARLHWVRLQETHLRYLLRLSL